MVDPRIHYQLVNTFHEFLSQIFQTLNDIGSFYRLAKYTIQYQIVGIIVKLQVLGLRLGVDFTFTLDNNDNDNNPHLNFFKGTVLGVKEQGLGIRDKG